MLLRIAWVFFGVEFLIILLFAAVFWYFWSHSAMSKSAAVWATLVYALGSVLLLLLALLLPL